MRYVEQNSRIGQMGRIIYVNGRYEQAHEAAIACEDRGFLFADGAYEVCEIYGGKLVEEGRHMVRLERSLREIEMMMPMNPISLGIIMRETVRRNRVKEGHVYLQVTRGPAPRDFAFPKPDIAQTVVCIAYHSSRRKSDSIARRGISVTTTPDTRWKHPHIKTVMLLPSVLARQSARLHGASEAWFIDGDGLVTEGASSNAWIIDKNGNLITRHADQFILSGITRMVVKELAEKLNLTLIERAFSIDEAIGAREAFITASTSVVMPVVKIDGKIVGDGKPGKLALELRKRLHSQATLTDCVS